MADKDLGDQVKKKEGGYIKTIFVIPFQSVISSQPINRLNLNPN